MAGGGGQRAFQLESIACEKPRDRLGLDMKGIQRVMWTVYNIGLQRKSTEQGEAL